MYRYFTSHIIGILFSLAMTVPSVVTAQIGGQSAAEGDFVADDVEDLNLRNAGARLDSR